MEKGGWVSPLLSSFSESVTKWVRRLKIIWLNFLETDTHSCLPATCFLPPSPSPLSPFPPAHLTFWEEISSFPCGGKETVSYGLTWPWHCLCQASCWPENLEGWILDSCFSLCTFISLKLPPSPLLFNNCVQHRLLIHILDQPFKHTHAHMHAHTTALHVFSSCRLHLYICCWLH